jgi:hypothetical protein
VDGECVVGRGRRRGDIAAARRAYRACRMAPAAAAGHAAVARARRRGCALRWRGRPWLSSAGGTGGAPRSVLPDHKRIFFLGYAICDAEKDYYSIGRPICGNMALLFGRAGDANRSDRRPQPGGSLAFALGTSARCPCLRSVTSLPVRARAAGKPGIFTTDHTDWPESGVLVAVVPDLPAVRFNIRRAVAPSSWCRRSHCGPWGPDLAS